MSIDNRHHSFLAVGNSPTVVMAVGEVYDVVFDATPWTDLNAAISTVGAAGLTVQGGSTGSAPTVTASKVDGQTAKVRVSGGTAGYIGLVKSSVTMDNAEVKDITFYIYVVAPPDATKASDVGVSRVDNRYIRAGSNQAVPSIAKNSDETFYVQIDLTDWTLENGATVSSIGSITASPSLNAPTLGSTSIVGGKVITGTLSGGTAGWNSNAYGTLSFLATLSNGEVKLVTVGVKIVN